jgi:hypothetical protein
MDLGTGLREVWNISNPPRFEPRTIHLETSHCNDYAVSSPLQLLIQLFKVKVVPQQAEVTQGVPGRLRPRISLTFGTTRVVGRQPYAPAAFTPGEIPGTHFQGPSRPQGTWFRRGKPRKKSPVTPPRIDRGTV